MVIKDEVPIEFDKWDNNPLKLFLMNMSFMGWECCWVCWAPVSCLITVLNRLAYAVFCLHSQIWMYLTSLDSFSLLLVLAGSSVHPAIQQRNQNLLSMLNIMLQPRTLLHQSRKEAAPYLNYPVTNLKPLNSSVKSKTFWFYSRYALSSVYSFSCLRLLACC